VPQRGVIQPPFGVRAFRLQGAIFFQPLHGGQPAGRPPTRPPSSTGPGVAKAGGHCAGGHGKGNGAPGGSLDAKEPEGAW